MLHGYAGRHLPEYNEYKQQKQKSFLELLESAADITNVTMQPVRRYGVDAAILFSDILVIPNAVYGMQLSMPGGVGIRVDHPIKQPSDFEQLQFNPPEAALPQVMQAIESINHTLVHEGYLGTPVIGFSAAPWTLMYFMCRDRSSADHESGSIFLHSFPEASEQMLRSLEHAVVEYLSAQVRHGAQVLQLFEAMGAHIAEEDFQNFAQPRLDSIATQLKRRFPDVPLLLFTRDAMHSLRSCQRAGFDTLTLDSSVDAAATRAQLLHWAQIDRLPKPAALQGNLDPAMLVPSEKMTVNDDDVDRVKDEARSLVHSLGPEGFIANLGGGLTGKEDPRLVQCFVETVQNTSM